jgi:translation initiation factor 4G
MIAHDFGFDSKERDVYLGSYIALATMLGQMIGSCISGFLSDIYSRKKILITSLLVGSVTTCLVGLPTVPYEAILVLRVFTGGCQASVVPVLFSLIGDYYRVEERATVSAVVSSCLGGGMMVGQLFVGFSQGSLGWRGPFVGMGTGSLLAAPLLARLLTDPCKGGNEDAFQGCGAVGVQLPPLSGSSFLRAVSSSPTLLLLLLQTLPNTVPWGVLSAHLHDLLATDADLSMQEATALIGVFGCGAAVGGLAGGFLGGKIYSLSRYHLPIFMGLTLACSSLLMKQLLAYGARGGFEDTSVAFPLLILAGSLAAVNGANIRVVVINLTSPEARGAAVALLNFVNCIGRGFGPLILDIFMGQPTVEADGAGNTVSENEGHVGRSGGVMSRREALTNILNLWLLAGALLCLASFYIVGDEDKLKQSLRKYVEDNSSVSKLANNSNVNNSSINSGVISNNFSIGSPHRTLYSSADRDRDIEKEKIGVGGIITNSSNSSSPVKLPEYLL